MQWVNSSDLLGKVKTSYILTTGKITHWDFKSKVETFIQ